MYLVIPLGAVADNLYDVRGDCLASPHACLAQTESSLSALPEGSREWYRLTMMKLLALIEMQQYPTLRSELLSVLVDQQSPMVFKATVYTLHSKVLLLDGKKAEGRRYLDKAVTLVAQINESYPDPFRSADILNLYTYIPELNEQAMLFAKSLIPNIERVSEPDGLADLLIALGHTFKYAGQLESSLSYYQKALSIYDLTPDDVRRVSVLHNVATGFSNLKNYTMAEEYFSSALREWAKHPGSEVGMNHTRLKLVENYILQERFTEASDLLSASTIPDMPRYQLLLYQSLDAQISANQQLND